MAKKETNAQGLTQDLALADFTVKLPLHIINDLKQMETFSKHSIEELVSTALLMFIATHSDYLGKSNR